MSQPQMLDETAVVDAAVVWFAVPPLSLTLLTGTASVRPYLPDANPPLGSPGPPLAFTGVDVDVWLATALGAVEQVLAAAADADAVAEIGLLKPRLAAVLAGRALALFADPSGEPADRTAAVAAVEQSLLASLTNAGVGVPASAQSPVGTAVPAPVCAFPEPVRLTSQQARQSVTEPAVAADLVAWQLSVLCANQGHPQDSFVLDVAYNTRSVTDGSSVRTVDAPMEPVFACLAEFVTVWPALEQDLHAGGASACAALASLLADLITALAALAVPQVPASPEEPAAVPAPSDSMVFEVDGLNVLRQSSALAGVSVVRNEHLLPGRTTNPAFVYRGPVTRFTSEVVPTIHGGAPIVIGTGSESVDAALGTFIRQLLDVPDHRLLAHRPRLRLAGTFCDAAEAGVELPIFLVPAYSFRPASDWDWTAPGSFVAGIGHTVVDWLAVRQAGAGGTIRFDLTVFSGGGRPKPLIQDVTLTYPLPESSIS